MNSTEKELKLLLENDSYMKILKCSDNNVPVNQVNYYFDTYDFTLDKSGYNT